MRQEAETSRGEEQHAWSERARRQRRRSSGSAATRKAHARLRTSKLTSSAEKMAKLRRKSAKPRKLQLTSSAEKVATLWRTSSRSERRTEAETTTTERASEAAEAPDERVSGYSREPHEAAEVSALNPQTGSRLGQAGVGGRESSAERAGGVSWTTLAQGRVPRGRHRRAPLRIPKDSVHVRSPSDERQPCRKRARDRARWPVQRRGCEPRWPQADGSRGHRGESERGRAHNEAEEGDWRRGPHRAQTR